MDAVIALCVGLGCLLGRADEGKVSPPPVSLIVAQEAFSKAERTERLLIGEQYRIVAGIVAGPETLTPFAGYLPLRIGLGRVILQAGAMLATAPTPLRGTSANWVARLRLQIAGPLHVEYWHMSNGRRAVPNPSLDLIGIGVRWTVGHPRGPKYEPCKGRWCAKPLITGSSPTPPLADPLADPPPDPLAPPQPLHWGF